MRGCNKVLLASSGGAITIFLAAACANSVERLDATSVPAPGEEAGAPAEVDASYDAEADVDAAPRVCSDDGFCHTELPPRSTLQAVWADGVGSAWAATKEGAILRWDGATWTVREKGLGELRAMWGSGPTEIWAVGAQGIYHGQGNTSANVAFVPSALPESAESAGVVVTSVWGSGPNDVWAVGARSDRVGRVYHYTGPSGEAGSSSWSLDPLSDAQGASYDRVWGSPGSGVWISSAVKVTFRTVAKVLRRAPSATSFSEVALPLFHNEDFSYDGVPAEIYAATASSDTDVWLAIKTDRLQYGHYHGVSADGGGTFTWSILPYDRGDYDSALGYTALAGSPSGVWAAGRYGRLETWDGKAFTQASISTNGVPVIDPFYGVWTGADGEVWAVGDDIALHRAKKP